MATLEDHLREWTLAGSYELDAITYLDDVPEVIETAAVIWPDGSTGTLTTIDFEHVDFQDIPTGYSVTHDDSELTVFQAAAALSSAGVVTQEPQLLITASAAAFGVAPFGVRPFGA